MALGKSLCASVALLGAGLSLPISLRAQPQDAQGQSSGAQNESVADAARRNREKKKTPAETPKPAKVITDEDLDKGNFKPGQEGLNVGAPPKLETEPPSAEAVAAAEAEDKASEKDAANQDQQIGKLKLQIADGEKDLDVAQRQLALDSDSYYSQTGYAQDTAGKAKLDGEKQQISDEQQRLEQLKARLAALEEAKTRRKPARKKAAPTPQTEGGSGNPPPPPQR